MSDVNLSYYRCSSLVSSFPETLSSCKYIVHLHCFRSYVFFYVYHFDNVHAPFESVPTLIWRRFYIFICLFVLHHIYPGHINVSTCFDLIFLLILPNLILHHSASDFFNLKRTWRVSLRNRLNFNVKHKSYFQLKIVSFFPIQRK